MRELIERCGYVPKTCVWEITRACNLRCQHCGNNAGCPRDDELTTEECLHVVDELAELGNELLTLSGGEPTLRHDWPAIARHAVARGIDVNLITNGQGNARALAKQAREVGLANVGVSLDGLRETHDRLRGEGTFDRACHMIRTLADEGLWVDVMFTANHWNVGEMADVHTLAGELGARGFRVQIGKPMGRQTDREDLTLTPAALLTLLPALGRLAAEKGPIVVIGDSVGYFSPAERKLRGERCAQGHWTGCYAGCQAIGIQSDGTVKGCLSLQPRAGEPDPFIEGSVRDAPLRDIWFRPGAFAYNREAGIDDLRGACATCSHGRICRGGAKCMAYAFTGSTAHDPMCYLAASHAAGASDQPSPACAAAAAAAILVSIGIAGCGGRVEPLGTGGAGGGSVTDAGSDADADAVDCTNVCCQCDYGVAPPPECCPP